MEKISTSESGMVTTWQMEESDISKIPMSISHAIMKWYPKEIDWDEIEPPVYQCSFCENKLSKPKTNSILTCPECLAKGKPKTRLGS